MTNIPCNYKPIGILPHSCHTYTHTVELGLKSLIIMVQFCVSLVRLASASFNDNTSEKRSRLASFFN